jgi:uncharacterized protein (DUF58 family)
MFSKFLYRNLRLFSALTYRLERRFTPAGKFVCATLIACAVVGVDTNQTVAYQAFTFLLALFLIALGGIALFPARFTAKRVLPRFVTAGEPFTYHVIIQNHSHRKQKGLYLIEDFADPRPSFEEFTTLREPEEEQRNAFDRLFKYHRWQWLLSRKLAVGLNSELKPQPMPVLLPDEESEIRLELTPSCRGILEFSSLTIARPDPLGLLYSLRTIENRQSVCVLSKRYIIPDLHLAGTRQYQSGGVALASSVGDSEEFRSLRDYRPGDPPRHIHWKSWAKTGKPVVKEYQNEFFIRHALVLDTFLNALFDEAFEEAVAVASSLACSLQTQESLLDLMFVGERAYCFTSGRGISSAERMLEILAAVQPCREQPFGHLASLVLNRAALLTSIICILLKWDNERQEMIRRLKALGIPLIVLVIANRDMDTTPEPGPMSDTPECLHFLTVGKIQKKLNELGYPSYQAESSLRF